MTIKLITTNGIYVPKIAKTQKPTAIRQNYPL